MNVGLKSLLEHSLELDWVLFLSDWVNTISDRLLEEIPRLVLLEAGHGKDVQRLLMIDQELEGCRWSQTFRVVVQVISLGEAHDNLIGACLVNATVRIVLDRDPFDFGDQSLRVGRLFSVPAKGVRDSTEGLNGDIGEKFGELLPHEG